MAGGPARVSPLILDSVRVLIGSCPPLFGQTRTPLPQDSSKPSAHPPPPSQRTALSSSPGTQSCFVHTYFVFTGYPALHSECAKLSGE